MTDLMLRDMGEYLLGSTQARAARQVTPAGMEVARAPIIASRRSRY